MIKQGYGYCVSKAVLLAAAGRAVGIPTRLGFADVKNHLSSEKLKQAMQSDVFSWHGYTEFYLDNKWVKATPAFNKLLCDKIFRDLVNKTRGFSALNSLPSGEGDLTRSPSRRNGPEGPDHAVGSAGGD